MDILILILQVLSVIGIIFLSIFKKNYFPKYLEEKAKNTATKEDISEITSKVESIKYDYNKKLETLKLDLSAQNDIKLERLKSQLKESMTKIEHFHQVSQATFQKLFEKKINIYQNLLNYQYDYIKQFKEGYNLQQLNQGELCEEYYNFYIDLHKFLQKNKLYISNNLYKKDILLYKKIQPITDKLIEINSPINRLNGITQNTLYKKLDLYCELMNEIHYEIEDFFKIIDNDTHKIREVIDISNKI